MIFSTSLPRFKALLGKSCHKAGDLACGLLFLTSFILSAGRRCVAGAARCILSDTRTASWLLCWLGSSRSAAALLAAAQFQLHTAARLHRPALHILTIDSTQHGQQGKDTENTFSRGNTKKRPKKSNRKHKHTHARSCHCFVFAVLLTPSGVRIPYWLPFYTKEFCKLFNRKHFTQADLAAQLIDSIAVPDNSRVVVVGDTAFEAKQVRKACDRRDWSWVVPLNPERRLAGNSPRPQVKSLYQQLQAQDFRKVSFRLDQDDLANLARVSAKRSMSSKHQRVYWVHHRIAAVHNVGSVALLFSTKLDPTTPCGVTVQKVLISNAVTATVEELMSWYSLRWQIELFFKELKSELGLGDYKLGRFASVVNWVNLSVLAYCYLEWTRWQHEQHGKGRDRPLWQHLRTHDLKEKVRHQVQRADIEEMLRLSTTAEGQQALKGLLDMICDDSVEAAA
jgi:hypothetical protein